MSVPLRAQVRPGVFVSIVLKKDQRTGQQVQGVVSQVLTRGDHPRGVKVRLSDGRIGRVQQLVNQGNNSSQNQSIVQSRKGFHTMADHNPWASDDSQTGQNRNYNQQYSQQSAYQSPNYGQQQPQQQYQQQSQPPQQQPYQQPGFGQGSAQGYYESHGQSDDFNAWSDSPSGNPPLPQRHPAHTNQPAQGIHRADTEDLLASQDDRAEQVEHLQAYEATANQSEDDKNRAQLEKEFPNIDGSLIAAIYGDTKNLSETREMLQELARE